MKKYEVYIYAIGLISTMVCAMLHYFSGEYIQACFWTLWAILVFGHLDRECDT